MNQTYVDTVRLLLAIAPTVFESQNFALKGGTALNLFVQDMPRLSVDIDVVFTDHTLERDAALEAISRALAQLQAALEARGYRAGHNRPVHEVLFPTRQPLESTFLSEFQGLTRDELPLALLEKAQQDLLDQLPRQLTPNHREFLLSLVRAEPVWKLMPFEHLRALPALKWKLLNLKKLQSSNAKRFALQHSELQARFNDLDAAA